MNDDMLYVATDPAGDLNVAFAIAAHGYCADSRKITAKTLAAWIKNDFVIDRVPRGRGIEMFNFYLDSL